MNKAEQTAALMELKFKREKKRIASQRKAHEFGSAVPLWSTMRKALTQSVFRVFGGASGSGADSVVPDASVILLAEVSGKKPMVLGSRAEPGQAPPRD